MSYAISCLSDIAIFWLVLVPYIIICIATAKLLVCCAPFGRLSSVQTLMLDAFKLGSFFLMVSSSRLLRLSSHFLVIGSLFCLSIELYAPRKKDRAWGGVRSVGVTSEPLLCAPLLSVACTTAMVSVAVSLCISAYKIRGSIAIF